MPSKKREQELPDRMWDRVAGPLPRRVPNPKGGRSFADNNACFAGIVYQLHNASGRTTCPRASRPG